jgi:hypothetical protein
MSSKYAVGKNAFGFCDVCGFRYKLSQLKPLTIKTKNTNILACTECWNPDQPQLQLGMYPVSDAVALRNPRPDNSQEISRDIQWGWDPVGLDNLLNLPIPNNLVALGAVGTVTVQIGE